MTAAPYPLESPTHAKSVALSNYRNLYSHDYDSGGARDPCRATYCAVVKETSDGFLNLRTGPGTKYPIVTRLLPSDLVWVDTGTCRTVNSVTLCDETGNWKFIEAVPRIDGRDPTSFTQGWVNSRFIQQVECTADNTAQPPDALLRCRVRLNCRQLRPGIANESREHKCLSGLSVTCKRKAHPAINPQASRLTDYRPGPQS